MGLGQAEKNIQAVIDHLERFSRRYLPETIKRVNPTPDPEYIAELHRVRDRLRVHLCALTDGVFDNGA
jgi:hypothetical protein